MDDKDNDYSWADSGREYAIGGKIMLSAIVVLFAVIVLLVALHLYARWYVVRLRRRQIQRRQGQRLAGRSEFIVYLDNWLPAAHRGLDTEVLNSLPVFPYSMSPPPPPSECAVCLSEFEGREIVRHLPKCGHSFHIECIDMWFHSHATCPLCRSPVEPVPCRHPDELEKEVNNKPEPRSSSDSETADESTTTSLVGRRKALRLARMNIEVPPRRAEWESESAQSSPAERILPSRRILNTGRRSAATTPSVAREPDLESALNGSSRSLNRVRTPR